jgi:hypothetical protein
MRSALRLPWLRPVILQKPWRIALRATVSVVFALLLTLLWPVALLVFAPIVLGVVHVASDVRYLVVRPRFPRAAALAMLGFAAAMIACRVLEMLGAVVAWGAAAEIGIGGTWVGVMLVAASAGQELRRRTACLALVVALITTVGIVFAHGARAAVLLAHPLVAIAAWLMVFRRRGGRSALLPLLAVALGCGLLLACEPVRAAGLRAGGVELAMMAAAIAPGLPVCSATPIVLVLLFLQSVHYAVWLRWIPEESTRAAGTLTFAMSLRSLRKDFGAFGIAATASLAAGVVIAALFAPPMGVRDAYLALAGFHAYLELAALAFLAGQERNR